MVLDRTLDGNVKADVRTEVRAVRDDRRLYVAFRCAEPSAEALRAQRRGHDGEIWSDDSVEMFIGSGSSYHHFGVNAVGSTYDGWRKDRSWNSGLTAAAAQGKEEWTAELAIPLAKLTAAGKAERWIANFNRNRHAGGSWQEFAWSPTLSGDSHVPAQFGTLVFGSAPPKKPGAGDDAKVRFLPVAETEGLVQFDLSDLPAGTKVYRADLLVFRKQPLTGFDDEAMPRRASRLPSAARGTTGSTPPTRSASTWPTRAPAPGRRPGTWRFSLGPAHSSTSRPRVWTWPTRADRAGFPRRPDVHHLAGDRRSGGQRRNHLGPAARHPRQH